MHLIFDLDNTITESRQDISPEMFERLSVLKDDIVVISGASEERMIKQLKGLPIKYILAQSGNDTLFWYNKLTDEEIREIYTHADKLRDIEPDMLENRGCQIALSFTGHNADLKTKKLFDPNGSLRTKILSDIPFESETLECRVGGSTCLDYTRKNGTKGKNIERLIKHLNWKKEDCIYYGDALFKGGNDESVVGVIKCIEVANPQDLMLKLKYV